MTDACTLDAIDHDGASIHFVDYVSEGHRVDLWDDPEAEEGFRGARIVYRDGDEWRLRLLTQREKDERLHTIRQHLGLEPGKVSDKPRRMSPFTAASRDGHTADQERQS